MQFDGVMLTDGPSAYKFLANHADITFGPGPVNFKMAGDDSTGRGTPGQGSLNGCTDKFVPFPVE